jgi:hypothetical protein
MPARHGVEIAAGLERSEVRPGFGRTALGAQLADTEEYRANTFGRPRQVLLCNAGCLLDAATGQQVRCT